MKAIQDMGDTQLKNISQGVDSGDATTIGQMQGINSVYINGVKKNSVVRAGFSVTVSSGSVVVYLTDNGLVSGNALFPNEVFEELFFAKVNDTALNPLFSWTVTNSNKTLTIICKQLTSVLGVLGFTTNLTNGTTVYLSIAGN